MTILTAEFTVEPFEPSNPGPHVQAAIEAVRRNGSTAITVEVGPFGTAITGPAAEVLALLNQATVAAFDNGATRISQQVQVDAPSSPAGPVAGRFPAS